MAGLEVYQEYGVTVPAGEVRIINTTGNYISCLSSNIDFKIGVDSSEPQFFTAGLKARTIAGEIFKSVEVDNRDGASPLTASLGVGVGDLEDNRLTTVSGVTVSRATVLDTVADVACANAATTVVLAANAARRRALFQNTDISNTVRIGDSNVANLRGYRLGPGQSVEISSTEEVSVRNDSGSIVAISVLVEAD